jgi:tRNA/tmRNA/rRNA uracil-C5-methylase (TrmA/RlmC/RlmD family)
MQEYKYKYHKYKTKYLNLKRDFVPEIKPQIVKVNNKIIDDVFNLKVRGFATEEDKSKIQLSNIGLYSVTDYKTADMISQKIKEYFNTNDIIVTDGTANMGGNTISFGKYFKHVNAIEIVPLHCDIVKNNIDAHKLDNIQVICGDFLEKYKTLKQDVIFLDPPWGGKNYKEEKSLDLFLSGRNLIYIVNDLINYAKLLVLKVPRNYNLMGLIRSMKPLNLDILKVMKMDNPNKLNYLVLFIKLNN